MIRKTPVILLVIIMTFGLITPAFAETEGSLPEGFALVVSAGEGAEAEIRPQTVRGEQWLFIPSFCDLSSLSFRGTGDDFSIRYNGAAAKTANGLWDLTPVLTDVPADGIWKVTVTRGEQTSELSIMKSANVSSMFLTSADPERGRAWVESSPDKSNKARGDMTLIGPDGSFQEAELTQIKGRGNTTWMDPKKPYQIKLREKADLINGDPGEAHSTWVLLANYRDSTLLGNQVMFDLAADLGLEHTPNCKPVDLYYDGEYRGSYLLSEKTQVGKGRVEINDLEKEIEDLNPKVTDMDARPTGTGKNSLGNPCQWVKGLSLPENHTGGYLLELDYEDRAMEEKTWFSTDNGQYYTVKSPEYLPKAGVEYISKAYQTLENAIYNKGVDPESGKKLSELADLHSMAAFFLVEEISYDYDAYVSSSYLYKDKDDERFYSGPVWDFDSIVGRRLSGEPVDVRSFHAGSTAMGAALLRCPEFRDEVKRLYEEEFLPLMGVLFEGKRSPNQDRLMSLQAYRDRLKNSENMNRILWSETAYPENYTESINVWKDQLTDHNNWLKTAIPQWKDDALFFDVVNTDWFVSDLNYVYDKGIMNGVNSACFRPYSIMNRAMAVTMLYRIAGAPATDETIRFLDVFEEDWYADAVKWGASVGLTEGYPDGTFCPVNHITREEFAVLLHRFTGLDEGEEVLSKDRGADSAEDDFLREFPDRASVSDWAYDGLSWAVGKGVMKGTDEGRLEPRGNALRCHAAAMIHRFMEI